MRRSHHFWQGIWHDIAQWDINSRQLDRRPLNQSYLLCQIIVQGGQVGGMLLLLTALQSCGLRTRQIETLHQIQQYPKTVTVEGRVGDRVPLVNQYVYELKDGTGTIWIQTDQAPPTANSDRRVRVKGQLHRYPMADLGNSYSELFIQELSHRVIGE